MSRLTHSREPAGARVRGAAGSLAGLLLLPLLAGCPARGSGAEGEPLPDRPMDSFSFPAAGGGTLAWDRATGTVTRGDLAVGPADAPDPPAILFIQAFQPDCHRCADLARSLSAIVREMGPRGVAAVGLAYRGDLAAAASFGAATGAAYPIAVATESAWARRWARGDPLYAVNRTGEVVFVQTGYRPGDEDLWRAVASDLVAGRPASVRTAPREVVDVGDPLPAIILPDLATGGTARLTVEEGQIVYRGPDGTTRTGRASVGFFSRY